MRRLSGLIFGGEGVTHIDKRLESLVSYYEVEIKRFRKKNGGKPDYIIMPQDHINFFIEMLGRSMIITICNKPFRSIQFTGIPVLSRERGLIK